MDPPPPWKSAFRENLESLLFPLILVLIARTFVFQAFKIPSESMRETLLVGDHILVNKSIYLDPIPFLGISLFPTRRPQRKDIMVFKYPVDPTKDFIKRVIGLGGETIQVRWPSVFIDGQHLVEPYAVYTPDEKNSNEVTTPIPPATYFMMGDNRDHSLDSRFWHPLSQRLIKGKAFVIYFSWDYGKPSGGLAEGRSKRGYLDAFAAIRWSRLFSLLH